MTTINNSTIDNNLKILQVYNFLVDLCFKKMAPQKFHLEVL